MRSSRGFTLVEMVVVVGIVAILSMVAVTMFSRGATRADLGEKARELAARIGQARSLAASGQSGQPAPWLATDRVQSAGLRFINATQYAVFIDRDLITDGDEIDIVFVDFLSGAPNSTMRLQAGFPAEIRMRNNGTLTVGGPIDLTVEDRDMPGKTRTVRVSLTGTAKVL